MADEKKKLVSTASQAYPVSTPIYLANVAPTDYFEIWVTSSNNADQVTVQDVSWLIDSK